MIRSLYSTRTLAAVAALAVTFLAADMASAQEAAVGGRSLIDLTSAFSVGLVVIGAAYGISKLASAAYEGMSRQPEVAGSIQTAMIIAAALIEGFTFYALFICTGRARPRPVTSNQSRRRSRSWPGPREGGAVCRMISVVFVRIVGASP
jgi:F-type H+-transporting ATPase subunit c